jgi:hypothetical protein
LRRDLDALRQDLQLFAGKPVRAGLEQAEQHFREQGGER